MSDDQPLTCVCCFHAPASRLLVVRWRNRENMRLLCAECAAVDEADAPGLPGFKSVTVLAVFSVSAVSCQWGVTRPEGGSGTPGVHNCGYDGEAFARQLLAGHRSIHGPEAGGMHVRETSLGPWVPVPGKTTQEGSNG